MSIHPDSDFDALVARLAGPLAPNMRPAFREAFERAVAQLACYGPGIVYRAVAPLQKAFGIRLTGIARPGTQASAS